MAKLASGAQGYCELPQSLGACTDPIQISPLEACITAQPPGPEGRCCQTNYYIDNKIMSQRVENTQITLADRGNISTRAPWARELWNWGIQFRSSNWYSLCKRRLISHSRRMEAFESCSLQRSAKSSIVNLGSSNGTVWNMSLIEWSPQPCAIRMQHGPWSRFVLSQNA